MTRIFSGHIYIFHAFDVGEDINLNAIAQESSIAKKTITPAKYFKNYHRPIDIVLPEQGEPSNYCEAIKIHHFGVVSLTYKIPFKSTLEDLRHEIDNIERKYREQGATDAAVVYRLIERFIKNPNFFHINTSYLLIQVNTQEDLPGKQLEEKHGGTIASILRFEDESLSEFKKNEILEQAFGYYRGDFIAVDTDATFLYDDEYEEALDLFEFVNIQHLELQYFDRMLDQKLTQAYTGSPQAPLSCSYLPGSGKKSCASQVENLGMLKVEISVITERLENSIKIVGEPYFYELYMALNTALDLSNWKESINKKLEIIHDLSEVYENRARTAREDLFNILISVLIFLELIVAIAQFWHR
ncbi:MAG: hypothetical protein JW725_03265 [Candidatus Babeliaceae bacterium]|nr:hypothetical protein [Candidatus Babeliaceae bacterium]